MSGSDRVLLTALRETVSDMVREMLKDLAPVPEWIDQNTSPLGRNLHLRLVRAKKLMGRRVGKKVLVHREEMNRFIVSFAATKATDPEDEIDRELRALELPLRTGMRVTSARRGGTRAA